MAGDVGLSLIVDGKPTPSCLLAMEGQGCQGEFGYTSGPAPSTLEGSAWGLSSRKMDEATIRQVGKSSTWEVKVAMKGVQKGMDFESEVGLLVMSTPGRIVPAGGED